MDEGGEGGGDFEQKSAFEVSNHTYCHVPNKIHTKLIDLKDVSELDDIEPRDFDFINFEDSFVLKTRYIVIFVLSTFILLVILIIVYYKFKKQTSVLNYRIDTQVPISSTPTISYIVPPRNQI